MILPESITGLMLALLVLITNILEIHILRMRKRKHLYECLLMSLSVSDLSLGFCALSLSIVSIAGLYDVSPNYLYITYYFFLLLSILHLFIISVDRLYAVAYPIHHRTNQRRGIAKYLIAGSWLAALLMTGGYIANYIWKNYHKKYQSDTQYCWVIVSMITYIIIGANLLYIIIYCVIAYLIWSKSISKQSKIQAKMQAKRQRRGVTLCACTVLAFVTFTSPFSINYVVHRTLPNKWTCLVLGANSAVNSLIFLYQKYFRS